MENASHFFLVGRSIFPFSIHYFRLPVESRIPVEQRIGWRFYFFAFLRAEPDLVAGFFFVDTLLLTAFLSAALGDGLEVEPDRRSSTAAPAASGRVSSPFSTLATCSLPASIVFETIRFKVPGFLAIWFSQSLLVGGGIAKSHLQFILADGATLFLGNGSLAGVGNIHRAAVLENLLRAIALLAVFGMNGQQNIAVLNFAFVPLRLVLRDTHADECTREAAGCRATSRARQCRHECARRDKASKPCNGHPSDPDHPAQRAAQYCAARSASRRALGSLGVLFVREVLTALFVGEENRHVVLCEAGDFEMIGYIDSLGLTL